MNSRILPVLAFVLICCQPYRSSHAADAFRDEVAPLLRQHCLRCHNNVDQEGDFSLQSKAAAFRDELIAPKDPDSSRLLEVITPVNGEAEMPKGAPPLNVDERRVIEKWIREGAFWPDGLELEPPAVNRFDWWSYQPLKKVLVPAVDREPFDNPIDAFVHRKLREKGLRHNVPADARTLIRRLTYDLTGLPPSPQEVAKFVSDSRSEAYERLVDRLLASPQYGEHWARHWLDVVKYADTCGYDKDKLRPNAWPYRDYVIRSLNEDKPYAHFVQEQIAGDVLFPGEPDGILGLGFIAAGPWDFIGHVEVPESKIDGKVARNLDRDDMVSNTLNTFCSVTVQCARCHNHKFDPITQQHYYGLQSLFAAVDRAERPYDVSPETQTRKRLLTQQLQTLRQKEKDVAAELEKSAGPRFALLEKEIASLRKQTNVIKAPAFGYHSSIEAGPDVEKWVEVQLPEATNLSKIILNPCHDEYAGIGPGFGFPIRFRIDVSTANSATTVLDQTNSDYPSPGLVPLIVSDLNVSADTIRVTATRLAERRNDFIFSLAELQAFDGEGNAVTLNAAVKSKDSIQAPVRWGRQNLTDGIWARYENPEAQDSLAAAVTERQKILSSASVSIIFEKRESITSQIAATQKQLNGLPKGKMVYAATTEFAPRGNFKPTGGKLRPIKVLHRGNIQQPLADAVPGFLPLSTTDQFRLDENLADGERRAALAKWLTDRDHPLVWRSIVNRIWQYHFGRGIVDTPNDFGRMGAQPTHPELLDWLAIYFRDNRQSMKDLHRLIVTSNTYRQSSTGNEENAAIDSGNRYLWRMNRRRLQAEEIRDSILAVSGQLNLEMGGPGFYLFTLEKTAHSPHYEYHKFDPNDAKSHRRSVYRFVVRSQPDPWMTAFDCADSSQSTPKRNETLTSLQALSLLNDKFNLAIAEAFAEKLSTDAADIASQVATAFQLVTQRSPTSDEKRLLMEYGEKHGMPNLCRMLFNLNEFVFVD